MSAGVVPRRPGFGTAFLPRVSGPHPPLEAMRGLSIGAQGDVDDDSVNDDEFNKARRGTPFARLRRGSEVESGAPKAQRRGATDGSGGGEGSASGALADPEARSRASSARGESETNRETEEAGIRERSARATGAMHSILDEFLHFEDKMKPVDEELARLKSEAGTASNVDPRDLAWWYKLKEKIQKYQTQLSRDMQEYPVVWRTAEHAQAPESVPHRGQR